MVTMREGQGFGNVLRQREDECQDRDDETLRPRGKTEAGAGAGAEQYPQKVRLGPEAKGLVDDGAGDEPAKPTGLCSGKSLYMARILAIGEPRVRLGNYLQKTYT